VRTGTTRCAVLAKPRSKAPPRGATRQRSSRPHTEPMPNASDVLCRGLARTGSDLSVGPLRWGRQARLRDRLVKGDRFVETRTPSLDECSLPRPLEPCGSRARDHREPATVPTALPPRAGFRRPFTVRARGRMARPGRHERSDQTPLVDFCNQNNPRAQPRDPPIPGSAHRRRSSPSLRWTGRRPPGWG